MRSLVNVAIHASQFPENVQRELLDSLRTRRINHKFLYDGVKQTQKWLALHEAFSPARTDPNCVATYDDAFSATAERIAAKRVHVIGLGCGGGQKDAQLLKLLKQRDKLAGYTPCDVSTAMVLTACQTASTVVETENCFPLVCDLATADDLPAVFNRQIQAGTARLLTLFGMLPNFSPLTIFPRLADLISSKDYLLLSANLAPGVDYTVGLQRVLPQYDNDLMRDWLMTFLRDIGVEPADGELVFAVEDCPQGTGLKRIVARFHFNRSRAFQVANERFEFRTGESVQLFFSYRHTSEHVRVLLGQHGIVVLEQWVIRSGEEGIFLCQRDEPAR